MKYVVVIGDGMADNPVPELSGKTPLEVAEKSCIDDLARAGQMGTVRTVPIGVDPGSDTAFLSIFGYSPLKYYSGRSPLEAAGSGIVLNDGEVSYRCNMVALEDAEIAYKDKKILSHSGGSVEGEESDALLASLLADPAFKSAADACNIVFHPGSSFRHIAVQKSADITGFSATPPHDHLGEVIEPLLPKGNDVAKGLSNLMEIAHGILNHHPINENRRKKGKLPANGIWFWAEGKAIILPSFTQRHGKKGIVVSAVPLVRGIGTLAGFDFTKVDGATGELDTNFEGKAQAVLKALSDGYDIAILHVEAPDECTHNGDLDGKLQAISWLSSRTVTPLKDGLDASGEDYRMLILSDHKTLLSTRGHDGDPVPYIIYDSRGCKNPSNLSYTEDNAQKGDFLNEGDTLIDILLESNI